MKSSNIGDLLVKEGKITQAEAEKILQLQQQQGLRFGEAGKASKLISEKDIQHALSQQFNFPFLTNTNSGLSQNLIAAYQPFSPQVETLRTIRSQLMLRWFHDDKKTLAIVSPNNTEGRSYFCANLAIVFAQLGQRTLLIDANLRQPCQHLLFNLGEGQGLSDFLANRVNTSVIRKILELPDLSILPAGTIPPNPLEIISRGLNNCLEKLALNYDVILLDTPAVSQGSDVQLLARGASGALLLARKHQTRLADMEAMNAFLEKSSVVCVGAIINDF
ncbi:MAG: chain length determinant protein tyrosine kinase EpsG [Methylococcaceae bacterium]|nr:chain length determinant protein tyrosine kinase EpsG [Methylococcaceae bacterium]MDD1609148.1 chain length determinant protein tyrosine kinase EpsG [Methylococcaceae bacterium]MDD1614939.1 chain length determinant protein tyrosine kinase EpsG [Methylococcaceae bacterium]OYV21531.1 MAG: chain length determinant protein tyrosine kinase EpsG [Methylococcaceae bacterium NSP1-2]